MLVICCVNRVCVWCVCVCVCVWLATARSSTPPPPSLPSPLLLRPQVTDKAYLPIFILSKNKASLEAMTLDFKHAVDVASIRNSYTDGDDNINMSKAVVWLLDLNRAGKEAIAAVEDQVRSLRGCEG